MLFGFAGTKIIYDRSFLLQMRSSPLSKTPPANLPNIPGVTTPSPKKNQKAKKQQQQQQQQQNDSNNATNASNKKGKILQVWHPQQEHHILRYVHDSDYNDIFHCLKAGQSGSNIEHPVRCESRSI